MIFITVVICHASCMSNYKYLVSFQTIISLCLAFSGITLSRHHNAKLQKWCWCINCSTPKLRRNLSVGYDCRFVRKPFLQSRGNSVLLFFVHRRLCCMNSHQLILQDALQCVSCINEPNGALTLYDRLVWRMLNSETSPELYFSLRAYCRLCCEVSRCLGDVSHSRCVAAFLQLPHRVLCC